MKSEPIVPSRFSEQLAYSTTIQEKKNNIQEISSATLKQCRSYEKREISPAEACVWKSKLDEESVWSLTRRIFQNELACPFDCRNNMHAEGAQIELNKWVLKTKLVPIGRHFKSFAAAKFALLTAMCHPDCDFNTLLAAAKWISWLFVYDDRCEKIKEIEQLEQFNGRNLAILKGEINPSEEDSSLSKALAELRDEALSFNGREWMQLFAQAVKEHFDSLKSEKIADLDLKGYLSARPYTGAPFIVFILMIWAQEIALPIEILQSDYIHQLNLACGNIICWSNDIISYPKESLDEDNNILFILQEEKKMSLLEAIRFVVKMHNDEVVNFIELSRATPFPEHRKMIGKYIQGLCFWLKAHVEWSLITERYKQANAHKAASHIAEEVILG